MKLGPKHLVLALVATAVVVVDQWSKHWVIGGFRLGETVPVLENFFNLTYIRNTGAAFGILAHADPRFRVPFFMAVPLLAIFAICYVFRRLPASEIKLSAALSLVIGGAVGNLIDRLLWGFVVDFLDFHWRQTYHFPAFNVADMAICIGVGTLMLDLVVREEDIEDRSAVQSEEVRGDVPASH